MDSISRGVFKNNTYKLKELHREVIIMKNNLIKRLLVVGVLSLVMLLTSLPVTSFGHEVGFLQTKADYELIDGELVFEFELTNNHTTAQNLIFSSGQQFEIIIRNTDGEEVYRYSYGKFFTMALVYRWIEPGETLNWKYRWDLTNNNGKALAPGKYTAEIIIVARPQNQGVERLDKELTTTLQIDLDAQSIIEKTSTAVIEALRNKDADKISEFVHPTKGVRFTPYTYISLEQDLVFTKDAVTEFFTDKKTYYWGHYDGTGLDIKLTPTEYYKQFIYSHDFINAEKIGYNKVLSSGNMLENQFEIYEDSIIVEYYFSGFNPDYAGFDWRSLRLVFEEYEGSWRLVGVISNQWTI